MKGCVQWNSILTEKILPQAEIDLIKITILTKFHEDCINNVPSEVYTWFF